MGFKQAVIAMMKVEQLRTVARKFGVKVENYRERRALAAGLGGSERVTEKALLSSLPLPQIRQLCVFLGVDSKGRRPALIDRLLASAVTTSQVEDSSKSSQLTQKEELKRRIRYGGVSKEANRADLKFGRSTDRMGFTPAGVSAFSDLRPAAVVRELIQNSLDAALIDAKEACARVRFEQGACTLSEIPGIESYRSAFKRAIKEHTDAAAARPVVKRIQHALEQADHHILSVTDNGVGLDGRRMSALLSDGVSAKGGDAVGTFGNGHSVVIPTSDLRYVLYGGITTCGQSYGAGQAVLASHRKGKGPSRSGRGIYLKSFNQKSGDVPFTLAQGGDIPQMIVSRMKRVLDKYGHGTAVIIPAFNNFGGEQPLRETVFKEAAFSFFQAIHDGRLVVELESPTENGVLDAHNLPEVLSKYQDERRSVQGAFLSGRKANDAYETLTHGELHEIRTGQGRVTVRLLVRETARRSVGLCRNGMWITEALPTFQGAFSDRQPFQALILLNSDRQQGFFELVREAETPLHDKLALMPMELDRRQALRNALREIREAIKELVPATAEEVYSVSDILRFQFDDAEGQGPGKRQPSYMGQVGTMHSSHSTNGESEKSEAERPALGGGTGSRNRKKARTVTEPIFRIVSVPTGVGRRAVHVECAKNFESAELRMFVDENVDATCDSQSRTQATSVLLSNILVNGRVLDASEMVYSNDGVCVGAKLGFLAENTKTIIETDYTISTQGLHVWSGPEPALKIEILSSRQVVPKEIQRMDDTQVI